MNKITKNKDKKENVSVKIKRNKKIILSLVIIMVIAIIYGFNSVPKHYMKNAFDYDKTYYMNRFIYRKGEIGFKLDNFKIAYEITKIVLEANADIRETYEDKNIRKEHMTSLGDLITGDIELIRYGTFVDCVWTGNRITKKWRVTQGTHASGKSATANYSTSTTNSSNNSSKHKLTKDEVASYNKLVKEDEYKGYVSDVNSLGNGRYDHISENVFTNTITSPLSTFSSDVDTASYSLLRKMIEMDVTKKNIPKDAIRIEEMINYFDYDYPGAGKDNPFGMKATISKCPWNKDNDLLVVGCRAKSIDYSKVPSNYVFLIDVSGSMYKQGKLDLLLDSMEKMISQLKNDDIISIVVYAGSEQVLLEGFEGKDKRKIVKSIDKLVAEGSTNGEAGINKAYEIAEKYYIEGGNNRIILATDGDFNVGVSSDAELVNLIEEKRKSGVGLSVLGFGIDNVNDSMMEKLADNGNGVYFYIDSEKEADKVLCKELFENTTIAAKDVKFQIEFNPLFVSEYRLIGYENRAMTDADFDNDSKDAGDMGCGQSITMMYEIKRSDGVYNDNLKYQDFQLSKEAYADEWMTFSVRYKDADGDTSYLTKWAIGQDNYANKPDNDYKFAALVAEYGMYMRGSEFLKDSPNEIESIIKRLNKLNVNDEYKKEFISLVKSTKKQIDGDIILGYR